MTRNLIRRVELMCPVYDPGLRQMLMNVLQMNLLDNVKARELKSTGSYERVVNDQPPLRSQFEAADIPLWKSIAAAVDA
jgi:polyphosphate kinase